MARPARLAAVFLVFLCFTPFRTGLADRSTTQLPTATVEIDFADYLGDQKSLSGMNHGASPLPEDADLARPAYSEFIDPLDFRIWSTGHNMLQNGFLDMVHESHPGAQAFLRVGAGRVFNCPFEGNPQRPYLDFDDYRTYLRCVAELARDRGVDVLDIWNEPNINTFKGDDRLPKRQLFYQTFKVAHETILEVWPEAVIAGPSVGKINQEGWLRGFMEFCERHKLEVPILTWHENGTIWNTDWFVDIPAKLQQRRADYVDSPLYRNVNVQQIVINEMIADAYDDIPANNLAVIYYLEQGGADGAARTCFPDSPGATCFEDTLNGLVTPPDEFGRQEKRAMWWVHSTYNETLKNRVRLTSDLHNVVGIANDRLAMIGLYEEADFADDARVTALQLEVRLKNVDRLPQVSRGAEDLRIRLYEIPYSARSSHVPVPELPLKFDRLVPIEWSTDGTAKDVVLSAPLEVHHVFVIGY